MATLYKPNGGIKHVEPENGEYFTADELHELIDGYFQIITLNDGTYLVCDDDGKLKDLPYNGNATAIWFRNFGMTDVLVGNVLICDANQIR